MKTIADLKQFVADHGHPEIAEKIGRTWCWPELGAAIRKHKQEIPGELFEAVTAALIATGDADRLYWYCRYVQDRDDVRAALKKARQA